MVPSCELAPPRELVELAGEPGLLRCARHSPAGFKSLGLAHQQDLHSSTAGNGTGDDAQGRLYHLVAKVVMKRKSMEDSTTCGEFDCFQAALCVSLLVLKICAPREDLSHVSLFSPPPPRPFALCSRLSSIAICSRMQQRGSVTRV